MEIRLKSDNLVGSSAHGLVFVSGMQGSGTTLLQKLLFQRYECYKRSTTFGWPEDSPLKIGKIDTHSTLSDYLAALPLPPGLDAATLVEAFSKVPAWTGEERVTAPARGVIIDRAPVLHQVRARALKAAFPDARVLVIFRDPVTTIDGLRRKWMLFERSDLNQLIGYWEGLYRDFVEDASVFWDDVLLVRFEDLVQSTDQSLSKIAEWCRIPQREQMLLLPDRPNKQGKMLRNVVGGVIQIAPDVSRPETLSEAEQAVIRQRLSPLYRELTRLSAASDSLDNRTSRPVLRTQRTCS